MCDVFLSQISTIIHKILEINFGFHVKQRITEMNSVSVFQEIFTSTDTIFSLQGGLSAKQQLYGVVRFS